MRPVVTDQLIARIEQSSGGKSASNPADPESTPHHFDPLSDLVDRVDAPGRQAVLLGLLMVVCALAWAFGGKAAGLLQVISQNSALYSG